LLAADILLTNVVVRRFAITRRLWRAFRPLMR
jgi:hypothetical protein